MSEQVWGGGGDPSMGVEGEGSPAPGVGEAAPLWGGPQCPLMGAGGTPGGWQGSATLGGSPDALGEGLGGGAEVGVRGGGRLPLPPQELLGVGSWLGGGVGPGSGLGQGCWEGGVGG